MKNTLTKSVAAFSAAALMLTAAGASAFADTADLEAGTYSADNTYSMYVNAMSGIEFTDDLYDGLEITVDENGDTYATLNFHKSTGAFSIYTVPVYHFINADKVTPGFYDADGNVNTKDLTYTLSDAGDTLVDADDVEYQYVTSLTFPVEYGDEEIYLWVYVDSQIMGCQFCDGSGTAGSNTPGSATPYKALLSIDWDSLTLTSSADSSSGTDSSTGGSSSGADSTTTQSTTITYTVEDSGSGSGTEADGTFEVSIPASIEVDASSNDGSYTITAESMNIPSGAYVTVSADDSGELTYSSYSLAFTNVLESGKLTAAGDSLNGTITVTDEAEQAGTYTGTIDFNINYFSN